MLQVSISDDVREEESSTEADEDVVAVMIACKVSCQSFRLIILTDLGANVPSSASEWANTTSVLKGNLMKL